MSPFGVMYINNMLTFPPKVVNGIAAKQWKTLKEKLLFSRNFIRIQPDKQPNEESTPVPPCLLNANGPMDIPMSIHWMNLHSLDMLTYQITSPA